MKIMTFSTYRTTKLIHGGQIRLNAIHDVLRRDGFLIKHVAVHTGENSDLQPEELVFPINETTQQYMNANKLRQDVHACIVFKITDKMYLDFEAALDEFDADVFWLEQPWLWPVVKRYCSTKENVKVKIIYGSQNVEFRLISSSVSEWDDIARSQLTHEVKKLEDDLCSHADGIVAVSSSDLEFFQVFKKMNLLAPNGVWPLPAPGGLDYWSRHLRHTTFGLFVGSAHPPNAEGFATMLGKDLSFMAPNEKIAVVGGVSGLLQNDLALRNSLGLILPRLILLDKQNNEALSTFFQISKVVILPIISGGGTNIKTAEALFNRKPIVATTNAFRGYESFMNFPNVQISDDPVQFRSFLKQKLSSTDELNLLTDEHASSLDNLLWPKALWNIGNWTKTVTKAGRQTSQFQIEKNGPIRNSNSDDQKVMAFEGRYLEPILYAGWHDFEEGGTWSKDHIASLVIKNPFSAHNLFVSISVEVLVPQGGTNTVNVYCPSGHLFKKVCTYKNRILTFCFLTNEDDFGGDNSLELYIGVENLSKPTSSGQIIDERKLGLRLKKLTLEIETDVNPRNGVIVHKKRGVLGKLKIRLSQLKGGNRE